MPALSWCGRRSCPRPDLLGQISQFTNKTGRKPPVAVRTAFPTILAPIQRLWQPTASGFYQAQPGHLPSECCKIAIAHSHLDALCSHQYFGATNSSLVLTSPRRENVQMNGSRLTILLLRKIMATQKIPIVDLKCQHCEDIPNFIAIMSISLKVSWHIRLLPNVKAFET